MMRKVRIEDAGSTKLIVGSSMDKSEFRDANEEIAARVACLLYTSGSRPASA